VRVVIVAEELQRGLHLPDGLDRSVELEKTCVHGQGRR
jgi:hypothetical protein